MPDTDIDVMIDEARRMAHESLHIHRNAGWVDLTRRLSNALLRLQEEMRAVVALKDARLTALEAKVDALESAAAQRHRPSTPPQVKKP